MPWHVQYTRARKRSGNVPTIFADRILSFDALREKVVTSELRVYLRKSRFGFNVELGWEISNTKDRNKLSSNVSSSELLFILSVLLC